MSFVRQFAKLLIRKTGYVVFEERNRYHQDGFFTVHNALFRSSPEFRAAYARGLKASKGVDPQFEWRVHVALWAAATALQTTGDFVECGVNAGFISSAIMHSLGWSRVERRFYLIDTFDGPVMSQFSGEEIVKGRKKIAEDAISAGAYVTDMARIRANFSEWPNAVVVQGAVPGILPAIEIGQVAFLHLDMNCALPEREALTFFWSRLSKGAVVLLDDYAYFGHDLQAKAMDEAAIELGAHILALPTGQALIIK